MPSFWFPVAELSFWNYAPFYGVAKVYDSFKNKRILIHCHAGKNRSPSIAYIVLKSEGYTDKEILEYLNEDSL